VAAAFFTGLDAVDIVVLHSKLERIRLKFKTRFSHHRNAMIKADYSSAQTLLTQYRLEN
jgi:hypothetical protein